MNDTYLIPGQPCFVWNMSYANRRIMLFTAHENGKLLFVPCKNAYEWEIEPYNNYIPIGTEWDFAPKWALDPKNKDVCSTVDEDGMLKIWNTKDVFTTTALRDNKNCWYWKHFIGVFFVVCGICPDKSRYMDGAWEHSLRARPEWAERK